MLAFLSPFYQLSFALSHFLLQPPWNEGRSRMIDNIFKTRDQNYPQGTAKPCRTDHPLNKDNNDEGAPWSRSNHLLGARLLPSSDG
jgi:hypothetical protein